MYGHATNATNAPAGYLWVGSPAPVVLTNVLFAGNPAPYLAAFANVLSLPVAPVLRVRSVQALLAARP